MVVHASLGERASLLLTSVPAAESCHTGDAPSAPPGFSNGTFRPKLPSSRVKVGHLGTKQVPSYHIGRYLSKSYRIRTLLASKEGVKKTKSVQILPNLTTSHSYGISDFGGRSLRNLKSSNFLLNQRAILILKMPLDKPGGGTQQKEHTCRAARVCGRDAGASQALSRVVMTAHSKGALVLAALQQKLAQPCLRFHATFRGSARLSHNASLHTSPAHRHCSLGAISP